MLCPLAYAIPVLLKAASVLCCNERRLQSSKRCIAVPLGPDSSVRDGLKTVAVP